MTKSRLGVCGAVAAAVVLIAPMAASAATFHFSFSAGSFSGSGDFISSDVSSPFLITNIMNGSVSDPNVNMGVASAITGIDNSYGGANNLLSYPVPPALAYVDHSGISFDTASGMYNLFLSGHYILAASTQGASTFVNSFTVTEVVPLPAALPLFAGGLGALGLLGWRRKRKAAAAA